MSKRAYLVIPVLTLMVLLASGAWQGPAPSASQSAKATLPAFVAQLAAQLAAQPAASSEEHTALAPAQLLERAIAAVAPNRVQWLRVALWQKMKTPELDVEAEGTLVRAPDHCARLELNVAAGGPASEVLVVSDGIALAKVVRVQDQLQTPVCVKLPTPQDGQPPHAAQQAKDQILQDHGCASPHALLVDLQGKLTDLSVQPGQWNKRKVLRLTGSIQTSNTNALSFKPTSCLVFLDAQSLWPVRVEWWGKQHERHAASIMLEMEFRDPEINRPLSHDECTRLFSYQPEETP